jgi:hypothetical protein
MNSSFVEVVGILVDKHTCSLIPLASAEPISAGTSSSWAYSD